MQTEDSQGRERDSCKKFPFLSIFFICVLLCASILIEHWSYNRYSLITPKSLLDIYAALDYPPEPYRHIGVAYALNPDDVNLMKQVAWAYDRAGNTSKAEAFYRAAYRKSGRTISLPQFIIEKYKLEESHDK